MCLFHAIAEKPGDEELDMLDLAFELTDTSRLGCQIILSKELHGLEVRVPTTINDARSWDGARTLWTSVLPHCGCQSLLKEFINVKIDESIQQTIFNYQF